MVQPRSQFTARSGRCGVALLALLAAPVASARACEDLTVRDAAFTEPRDVHLLCVIADADDAEAGTTYDRLRAWQTGPGAELNIEVVRVRADDPDLRWSDYGLPSAPPKMPVAALIGRQQARDRTFYIAHWEPAPTDAQLNALLSSPARMTIRKRVLNHIAVLLYVPGSGPDAGRAEPLLEAAVKRYADRGLEGISILRVERSDEQERLLLSFANVPPTGPDWVGVVFGRGKFMKPLEGSNITDSTLTDVIEQVVAECTCTQTAGRMGVDVLMKWNDALDAKAVALVGTGSPGELFAAASLAPKPDTTLDVPITPIASIMPDVLGSGGGGALVRNTLLALVALLAAAATGTVVAVRRKIRRSRHIVAQVDGV